MFLVFVFVLKKLVQNMLDVTNTTTDLGTPADVTNITKDLGTPGLF